MIKSKWSPIQKLSIVPLKFVCVNEVDKLLTPEELEVTVRVNQKNR